MNNLDWAKAGLKRNPFSVVPDRESEDLIWAGFQQNKEKFDGIIKRSLNSQESKVILNISRYGGGKTHASFFYAKVDNLPIDNEPEPLQVIVVAPKRGDQAPLEFYLKIIEGLSITYISSAVKQLKIDRDVAGLRDLQNWTKSEDLGRILWLLADDNEDISFGAEQLLLQGSATSSLKNKLRLRRGMAGMSDISQMLSAIIKLLSQYSDIEKLPALRRIFIWIDELESLIFYTSNQYRPFTQTLRELIDNTPNYLSMVMNFSFAEPTDVQNLEIVIGEALVDRVTDTFIFEEANLEDAKQYVKDLFAKYRLENYNNGEYFPFTESVLVAILTKAPIASERPLLPRTINKWCAYIINKANEIGTLEAGINMELIEDTTFTEDELN